MYKIPQEQEFLCANIASIQVMRQVRHCEFFSSMVQHSWMSCILRVWNEVTGNIFQVLDIARICHKWKKNISFVYAVCFPLPCCSDFQLKSMYFLKARSKFSFIQSCKNFVLIGFRKKNVLCSFAYLSFLLQRDALKMLFTVLSCGDNSNSSYLTAFNWP